MDIVYERPPLPYPAALRALAGCCASTARLLRQHRLHLPARRAGTEICTSLIAPGVGCDFQMVAHRGRDAGPARCSSWSSG